MREEIRWEDESRDEVCLEMLVELGKLGLEFVIHNGHLESVIWPAV